MELIIWTGATFSKKTFTFSVYIQRYQQLIVRLPVKILPVPMGTAPMHQSLHNFSNSSNEKHQRILCPRTCTIG